MGLLLVVLLLLAILFVIYILMNSKHHKNAENTNSTIDADSVDNNSDTVTNQSQFDYKEAAREFYSAFMEQFNSIDGVAGANYDLNKFIQPLTEEIDKNNGFELYSQFMNRICRHR